MICWYRSCKVSDCYLFAKTECPLGQCNCVPRRSEIHVLQLAVLDMAARSTLIRLPKHDHLTKTH